MKAVWRSALYVLLATLTACSATVSQLDKAKDLGEAGEYEQIAAFNIECAAGEQGCNQLHLIKGDACLRLAQREENSVRYYDCAITHLSTGIDQTRGKTTPIGSLETYYENLLEALRQRQDLARSLAESAPFTEQLASRAGRFQAAYPDSPAGPFYQASARLTMVLNRLTSGGNSAVICRELNDILNDLATVDDPGRYAANLRRLRNDIRGARATIAGCE